MAEKTEVELGADLVTELEVLSVGLSESLREFGSSARRVSESFERFAVAAERWIGILEAEGGSDG